MKINRTRRQFLGACCAVPVVVAALSLSGCSGGFNNNFYNGDTGTYYSADQPVGNGVGRSYVELNNGIPIRLGMELTPAALTGLPNVLPDAVAAPFLGPLPSKNHGNAFTNAVLAYASAHPATNEPAHFHLAFFIRPLLVTAPPFALERAPVAAREVPQDHVRVVNAENPDGVIIGGGGVFYDDQSQPQGAPPLTTLGQNYVFLEGHMNGLTIGPTIQFLASKQSFSQIIKQPQFYPREGYYPTRWKVRFDTARNVHIMELTDFKIVHNIVPPGTPAGQ